MNNYFSWQDCHIEYKETFPYEVDGKWELISTQGVQTKKFICSHPNVKDAHLYGGGSLSGEALTTKLCLEMVDGGKKEFDNPDKYFTEANKWLDEQ